MECPVCEDSFVLSKEYDIHIKKHLEEIQGTDIDCLKNGHKIFESSMCDFKSKASKKEEEKN